MLAVFTTSGAAQADAVLARVAAGLAAAGVNVAGCLQDTQIAASGQATRWLRFLDGSAPLAITQTLGAGAAGCSLDPSALATAAGRIAPQIAGAQVLILNRFGRSEATGGGFRDLIVASLDAGVPVVTNVPDRYRAEFDDFAGDMACWLPGDADPVLRWILARAVPQAGFRVSGGIGA